MEIKHDSDEWITKYSKDVLVDAHKIVTDNALKTKLIGYMLGVDEQALEIAVLTHIEPASYAVISFDGTLRLNHPNALLVEHYQRLFQTISKMAEHEANKIMAVIEMLSGKFDIIIFKSTSRVNNYLKRKELKFYFVYADINLAESCLKQFQHPAIQKFVDDKIPLFGNFDLAIKIIDKEVNEFMTKIKFISYTNLSLILMNELKQ